VPLSEHEQQLLEQMEQALYAEDPKFASHMQGAATRSAIRRRYIIGALGLVVGLALVLVGVNTVMWVGVAGFAVMVGGGAYAFTPPRQTRQKGARLGTVQKDGSVRKVQPAPARKKKKRQPSSGSFMERLEERWERRRHNR
jgi:hypothetical protein